MSKRYEHLAVVEGIWDTIVKRLETKEDWLWGIGAFDTASREAMADYIERRLKGKDVASENPFALYDLADQAEATAFIRQALELGIDGASNYKHDLTSKEMANLFEEQFYV
jgi:hypothetical protein